MTNPSRLDEIAARADVMGRLMCRLGLHKSNYTGCAYSFAPAPIRCERCRKKM